MYSTWFHQINSLAGQQPEILDLLTPEKLDICKTAEKEGYHYESAACGRAAESAGLKRL